MTMTGHGIPIHHADFITDDIALRSGNLVYFFLLLKWFIGYVISESNQTEG